MKLRSKSSWLIVTALLQLAGPAAVAGTEPVDVREKLVHVSVARKSSWDVGDEICIKQGRTYVGCSKVLKRKRGEVQVRLPDPENRISLGKKLVVLPRRTRLASLGQSYVVTAVEKGSAADKPKPPPSDCASHAHGLLVASPQVSLMTIEALDKQTGAPGTFSSKVSTGLDLRWNAGFFHGIEPRFYFNLTRIELVPDAAKTLTDAAQLLWSGGAGFAFHPLPGDKVMLSLFGGMGKEVFFRALAPNSLILEGIAIPSAALQLSIEALRLNRFSLGFEAGGSYFFSGQNSAQTVSSGIEYHAKAVGTWEQNDLRFIGGLSAGRQSFTASLADQSKTVFLLEVGLGWKAK